MANQIFSSGTELAAIVPEIWSAKYQETNRALLPFIDLVSDEWRGEMSDLGDILNINKFPEFSQAALLSEGAAGDAESVTVTQTQLTVNNRPYKDFIVTKKSQLQSLDFMDKLRDNAIYAIQKKIQQIIVDAIVPSASAPDHQIAYDSGSTLALADILEAKELLMTANCPMEDLHMVVGAAQYNDLYNISGFNSKDFVPSGSPLSSGEFQVPLAGFMPHFTTVAGSTSYFFQKDFMAMVMQQELQIEVVSMGADGIRGTRVNVDALMGVAQLDDERVVTIS